MGQLAQRLRSDRGMNTPAIQTPNLSLDQILKHLGQRGPSLMQHDCETVAASSLCLPGPDFVDRVWSLNVHDQVMFASVDDAWNMGAVGVGATIYFGSPESRRQLQEVSEAFSRAHDLGLFTVLWCYVRNNDFTVDGVNHESSADLTGQANHLGATLAADFLKQKQPVQNGGYRALNEGDQKFGKFDERIYGELSSVHPIDMTRYQVLNGYAGRCGLINSGGASGDNDFQEALLTAVINKRAGGMGLITGRKAFQRPMEEGVQLLHAIQDVYLSDEITVA